MEEKELSYTEKIKNGDKEIEVVRFKTDKELNDKEIEEMFNKAEEEAKNGKKICLTDLLINCEKKIIKEEK